MKELQPDETIIIGNWLENNGSVIADDTCRRIEWLVKSKLEYIAKDLSGWETLYRDPHDGRLWEHTYPHSDWQGGGPPQLKVITPDVAVFKYRINSL